MCAWRSAALCCAAYCWEVRSRRSSSGWSPCTVPLPVPCMFLNLPAFNSFLFGGVWARWDDNVLQRDPTHTRTHGHTHTATHTRPHGHTATHTHTRTHTHTVRRTFRARCFVAGNPEQTASTNHRTVSPHYTQLQPAPCSHNSATHRALALLRLALLPGSICNAKPVKACTTQHDRATKPCRQLVPARSPPSFRISATTCRCPVEMHA